MRTRAVNGSEKLKSAVVSGDQRTLHQFKQTLDLMKLWGLVHSDALISTNETQRTIALAAIEIGSMRPLLNTAYILGQNNRVTQSLLRAFPQQKQDLEKIQDWARLSEYRYPKHKNTSCRAKKQESSMTKAVLHERALGVARRAIQELGSTADRHALLLRAQEIWQVEASRQTHPLTVDVS